MKILSISTENFRLHAKTDVAFPRQGTVGIIGANESGKSALLEAIEWAFFGGDATRGTMDGVRWHRAPARHTASVYVDFEIGGRRYSIERGENNARLIDVTEGTTLVEGTRAVNEFVPTLIGMTHGEFAASYLVRQKDVTRIADMLPTERQAFIRQVMGVGKIDEALKNARKRKAELAQERRGLEAGLGERDPLEKDVADAEEHLEKKSAAERGFGRRAARTTEEHEKALAALNESSSLKDAHDRLKREHDNAANSVEATALEIERLENRVKDQKEAKLRIARATPELSKVPDLRKERDELVEAKAAAGERERLQERDASLATVIENATGGLKEVESEIAAFDEEEYEAVDRRVTELDAELDVLRRSREENRTKKLAAAQSAEKEATRYERRLEAIQEAGAEGDCPTCLRTLDEQFQAVVDTLTEEMERLRAQAKEARQEAQALTSPTDDEVETEIAHEAAEKEFHRVREAKQQAAEAERRKKALTERREEAEAERRKVQTRLAELPEADTDTDRLAEIDAKLACLEELDESLAGDRGLVSQVDDTQKRLAQHRERKAEAEKELKETEEAIDALRFDADEHERLRAVEETTRKEKEDARVAHARAEEALQAAVDRLKTAKERLEEYDRKAEHLGEVLNQHHLHEKVDARLSDFRVAVAATIRPEMEELMSGFVHLLTDGRHEAVTLSEDFEATLHESGVPVEVVSGGTEDIAALAMRLAISQMISERAGHPLSLLILDEPFGSLDVVRRGNVLNLIQRLRGVFEQVIVISHVEETRDAVDHVIELEYDEAEGMTRVVTAPVTMEGVA